MSTPPLHARRTTWTTSVPTKRLRSPFATTFSYVALAWLHSRIHSDFVFADVAPQVNWNETQLHYSRKSPKRAYYLSLEFLMGRTLDNALLNLGLKEKYQDGVDKLGFNLEDLIDQERDAGLGNGGLGRLAACYLDSSASQELPVWGYGLRYKFGASCFSFSVQSSSLHRTVCGVCGVPEIVLAHWVRAGIFQQLIAPDGSQLEAPDPWLEHDNPWELARTDVTYQIRFYGHAERVDGMKAIWQGGQEVVALAYDLPIPGYETKTTNNLRLWESKPKRGFDLQSFNGACARSVTQLCSVEA